MKLFDAEIHDLHGPASHNVNTFDYYNQSSREDIKVIQETMEAWFSN